MQSCTQDSFGTRTVLTVGDQTYHIFHLQRLGRDLSYLPFSIKVLLENLLRNEDGLKVRKADVEALLEWNPERKSENEISFMPGRVVLQDFTGVPVVVDLATMRDAMVALGGDPRQINPVQPVDLVIDHSVQVDNYGTPDAFEKNVTLEFERNQERYEFLRWAQTAFRGFRAVPPGTGIIHQVNLEYLASVVSTRNVGGQLFAFPDTLVGTDSHTTMVNGLGVVGWGVGGIEAEAAMVSQPIAMLIPEVVGFRLAGQLPAGATATDLVLTVTQMLRKKGVVDKFVEFFGPGIEHLSLPDRATLANMAPEYGATIGFFPVDAETLRYLRLSGRDEHQVRLVEAYCKEQGLFRTSESAEPHFTDKLELDLSTVVPSIAGPKRPQDRIILTQSKQAWRSSLLAFLGDGVKHIAPETLDSWTKAGGSSLDALDGAGKSITISHLGNEFELNHGAVVIAAITSCTNTSNPSVLIAAGLLAKKAVALGLRSKPWVKTSLAPGSQVVTEYLKAAGLQSYLDELRFNLVGYGCTTCIGNSGPLPDPVASGVQDGNLVVAAVLSGNRNFEGRINAHVKANYLASPPLVVAYALAGTMDIDWEHEPVGTRINGQAVFLRDIWPSQEEVQLTIRESIRSAMYTSLYSRVFDGDMRWQSLQIPTGDRFAWSEHSTYVKKAPYFEGMTLEPPAVPPIQKARVLAMLGDSVTTDHISPAGSISPKTPAGQYLLANGVSVADFNQYGARRGNHEVMMRGTFANIRLRNMLAPGTEGGFTRYQPDNTPMTIYDAAMKYLENHIPLIIIAGREYGTGSSRDWAAKGTMLLGVKAVIVKSFERIHRSNLVGMGILPLQFLDGQDATTLGLYGRECFDILGIENGIAPGATLDIIATSDDGKIQQFQVRCRIDTPQENLYYQHGGILNYAIRQQLTPQ